MKVFKRFALILFALVIGFSVAACNETEEDPGGVITLKLWTPISGPDLTYFERMVTKFNNAHEDISVSHTSEVRETHYANIKNNVPDSGPDMAILHSQLVQNYAEKDLIIPIDNSFFNDDVRLNPADYLTKVMSTLYYENAMYGVPLDVHPIVLYYNKDIVGDEALPADYDSLMVLAKKLTTSSVNGLPISTLWPSEFLYTTALYQNGGQECSANSEPLFASTAGAQAALNMHDIIHTHRVSPNNLGADQDLNMFTSGKAAMHINGTWLLSSMTDSLGDKLGVMPMSNLLVSGTAGAHKDEVFARSHIFTVTKPRRSLSSRKKLAITTFIKWMGENSAEWSGAGQIPAFNAARDSETYKNTPYMSDFGNPDNFRTAASAVYFESGYETVFEYITMIMKDTQFDTLAKIENKLIEAKLEAERAVLTEQN